MHRTQVVSLVFIALMVGALIAFVDASPGWDDTGISAAMVLTASGLLSTMNPKRAWLWALAVGVWIPLLTIALHGSYVFVFGIVGPLGFALGGAYVGAFVGKRMKEANGSA